MIVAMLSRKLIGSYLIKVIDIDVVADNFSINFIQKLSVSDSIWLGRVIQNIQDAEEGKVGLPQYTLKL